jgi:hypothetical protein
MKPDDFEQQLQRQPLRPVPVEWRDEILAAARAAGRPRPSTLAPRPVSWWRELLWPSPVAWAGAAATWALILALNTAASPEAESAAAPRFVAPPAAAVQMALAERRVLMTSLFEPLSTQPKNPPQEPIRPRPQSARRADWLCA